MIFIVQQIILIICLSISFDYVIGEPPNSIHPVVWYGKIINFFTTKIKKNKKSKLSEKLLWIPFGTIFDVHNWNFGIFANNKISLQYWMDRIFFNIGIYPKVNVFNKINGHTYQRHNKRY